MKIYNDVVSQLDAGGAHYSQELSEIDLSDPDDVKVTANNHAGEVLVHLGSANYLERYKIYVTHCRNGSSSSTSWNRWTCATTGRSSSIRICRAR